MVLISPKGNALVRNTPQGVFCPPFSWARSTKLITVSRSSGDILLTFDIIDSKASWTNNHKTGWTSNHKTRRANNHKSSWTYKQPQDKKCCFVTIRSTSSCWIWVLTASGGARMFTWKIFGNCSKVERLKICIAWLCLSCFWDWKVKRQHSIQFTLLWFYLIWITW